MGGFYGSVQIQSEDRDRIINALDALAERLKFNCLVSAVTSGWIGVYPDNGGQSHEIGRAIAAEVGGIAWHVLVHDDSVLAYWLWRDGELIDVYLSCPGYFSDKDRAAEEPLRGDPELLATTVGCESDKLRELLDRNNRAVFEVERLGKLGKLVGVMNLVASYEYLKDGETDGITGAKKFVELPQSEKKKRAAEKRAKRQEIQSLKKRGVLLHHEKVDDGVQFRACAVSDGFLVFSSTLFNDRPVRVTRFRLPKLEPEDVPWPLVGHVTQVVSDTAGSRVAVCLGTHIELWDAASGKQELEIPASEWTAYVYMSLDGSIVATIGRPGLKVFDAESGAERMAEDISEQAQVAIHPGGEWIVESRQGLGFKRIGQPGEWRVVPISLHTVRPDLGPVLHEALANLEAVISQLKEKSKDSYIAYTLAESEHHVGLGFSRDGQWVWCTGTRGIWVFRWSDVLARGEASQAVWWHPTSPWHDMYVSRNYVYGVVEEPGGQAIRFSTLQGELFRLDLTTGVVNSLFRWPEGTPIKLINSTDGSAVGCISSLGFRDDESNPRQEGTYWQIWDSEALARLAP